MKQLYLFLLMITITPYAFGQIIYSENMGAPSSTTLVSAYTGWQNTAPIVYTGNGDVRTSTASNGYAGASGGGNVWFTTTAPIRYFQISGINTSAYNTADLQLKFGYLTSNVSNHLIVEQSSDGTNWSPISYTQNTTTSWTLVTISGGILSTPTLSLRFTQSLQSVSHRLDDISIANVSASCTFAYGTEAVACDAVTLAIDTYTATIPFSGAANGTYTVTSTAGVVGGDNPTSVATGNIVVTGIPEGTDITVTVNGATCVSLQKTINAPDCKPVNSLPFYDHFNYTDGVALGAQQSWADANSGDQILVTAGNLTYTGITSTGNSISFSGSGMECHTPFTETTSGVLYADFLLKVTDYSNVTTDGTSTVFAAFTSGSASTYLARLFVKNSGTQYMLGLDTGSTTSNFTTDLYNVGDVVYVILSYDFSQNLLKAWFNPDIATFSTSTPAPLEFTPASAITTIGGFLLRQDGSASTPSITIDELNIATSLQQVLSVRNNTIPGFSMYPNPVSNQLFIHTEAGLTKNVQIFDLLGKQVLAKTIQENTLDITIPSGIYLIKVEEAGKVTSQKLVVK